HLEEVHDVVADALVHLLPEIDVMRVEGVVEIEHPRFDVAERAGRVARRGCQDGSETLASGAPVIDASSRGARALRPFAAPPNRDAAGPRSRPVPSAPRAGW